MDWTKIEKLFNEVIKEYEKESMFSILAYSTDYGRDIKLLDVKVQEFKKQLEKLRGQDKDSQQARDSIREEDLQKEPI